MTFELLPHTCIITDRGTPNEDDNGATRTGGSSRTVPCRFVYRGERVQREDGSHELGCGTLYLPAGAELPADCTVTVDGLAYQVLTHAVDLDAHGLPVGVRATIG